MDFQYFRSVQFSALKLCLKCCSVISPRDWEWESKDYEVFSFVSTAWQREEKNRKPERDLSGKHSSFAKTDPVLPFGRYLDCMNVDNKNPISQIRQHTVLYWILWIAILKTAKFYKKKKKKKVGW